MKTKLYVSDGRVHCPRRGDIDVDTCIACEALRDIRREGDEEVLECRINRIGTMEKLFLVRW